MTSATSTHGGLPRALIITKNATESLAVCGHLNEVRVLEDARGTVYHQGIFQREDSLWMVGVAEIEADGPGGAREVDRAIVFFKSQITLFVGVMQGCDAVSSGDVVVATRVYGYPTGMNGEEQSSRPDEFRPNYTLLDRVREEVEGLAWLSHVQGGMPVEAPRVVLGQIAAGESVLSSVSHSSFPLLPRQQGDVVAVTSRDISFYRAAFQNNAKALLVQGIASLKGDLEELVEGEQEKAADVASAFAFHLLTCVTPVPLHELRAAKVGLGPRSTWTAGMMALLFGIIVSLPLFCVRQNPFVKEAGVDQWTVWLGTNYDKYKSHVHWVVTTGKKSEPVALLYLTPSSFDGFGPATPLYWNPDLGGESHLKWGLHPWKQVEPPVSLRRHPWLTILRRSDGSLTFPTHLYPVMPKRGRGLVYATHKSKTPVGEISFVSGPQFIIRRVYWDWRTLSEEQGPWVLRLMTANQKTPTSLRKHYWPPLLTLQQDRLHDEKRWRFLDKVSGLQWPGSRWIVLRPGTERTTQEPFGLVELEPGEGRWVKVYRMSWSTIQDFRHIKVKYFDPNQGKLPNLSRFGEIKKTQTRTASFPGVGRPVETNLGSKFGAQLFRWYRLQGKQTQAKKQILPQGDGYVQLLQMDDNSSVGQAFLVKGQTLQSNHLIRLEPKQQKKQALKVCDQAVASLQKRLTFPNLRLQSNMITKQVHLWKEQIYAAYLLGGSHSSLGWLPPPMRSKLGQCLSRGQSLIKKMGKRKALTWTQRWRSVVSIARREPTKAYNLLLPLCDAATLPESRQLCYRALLKMEFAKHRPIPRAWEKRLRLMISHDPCFTITHKQGSRFAAWKILEEQLRILDKKLYRKKYCRLHRYELKPLKILMLQIYPDSSLQDNASAHLLGFQLTDTLLQRFRSHWNEQGLEGVPQLLWSQKYRLPDSNKPNVLSRWLHELAKHSGATLVLAGRVSRQQGRFVVQMVGYANTSHNVFGPSLTTRPLGFWSQSIPLEFWSKPEVTSHSIAGSLWPILLRAQRRPLPLPTVIPSTRSTSQPIRRRAETLPATRPAPVVLPVPSVPEPDLKKEKP